MKASELHRKLLYKGHSELSAFFEENPLNYLLYQFLRDVKPRHQVNMSMVTIFNEVYFNCIRASRDLTPGDNIFERYISEEKIWTGSSLATDLIFCMVYMVLSVQKKQSYPLECFRTVISSCLHDSSFWGETESYIEKLKAESGEFVSDFTPQPIDVNEIPSYTEPQAQTIIESIMEDYSQQNPWRILTNNYTQTYILDFLRCYHSSDDQRVLLERIKESSQSAERMMMEGFYEETLELIDMGEFLPRKSENPAISTSAKDNNSELSIAYQQIEFLKQQITDLEQTYMAKLNEQRADFDRRLSRMDALYQAELDANIEANEKEKSTLAAHTEPSFTLKELVAHACSQCSPQSADAITTMLYRLAGIHGYTDSESIKLIDSIIPAIDQRHALQQTMQFPHVQQFNNNPQAVTNQYNPDKTSDDENQD